MKNYIKSISKYIENLEIVSNNYTQDWKKGIKITVGELEYQIIKITKVLQLKFRNKIFNNKIHL